MYVKAEEWGVWAGEVTGIRDRGGGKGPGSGTVKRGQRPGSVVVVMLSYP